MYHVESRGTGCRTTLSRAHPGVNRARARDAPPLAHRRRTTHIDRSRAAKSTAKHPESLRILTLTRFYFRLSLYLGGKKTCLYIFQNLSSSHTISSSSCCSAWRCPALTRQADSDLVPTMCAILDQPYMSPYMESALSEEGVRLARKMQEARCKLAHAFLPEYSTEG